jgi:hypothetical protein
MTANASYVYFVVKQIRLRSERETVTAGQFLHSHPANIHEQRRQALTPAQSSSVVEQNRSRTEHKIVTAAHFLRSPLRIRTNTDDKV